MPTMVIQADATVKAAEQDLADAPTLFQNLVTQSVGRSVKSGRANLVKLLWGAMALRYKTIIKRRAKWKFMSQNSGEVVLTDEPMQATGFKGKWASRAYNVQVLKSGYSVVVPAAFKGKGLDGKFALFSRDENSPKIRQTSAHYKKNIGKLRHVTHKVKPITMEMVVAKRPDIVAKETEFIEQAFYNQMTKGVARALGVK